MPVFPGAPIPLWCLLTVDLCLAGPDGAEQAKQAFAALDQGSMDADELAWMRGVGDRIYSMSKTSGVMGGKSDAGEFSAIAWPPWGLRH